MCVCIVHSAGVGRTGTYIALDIMLQQMPKTNTVNVYECVRNMRAKRLFMVQTLVRIYGVVFTLHVTNELCYNRHSMCSFMMHWMS